MGTEVQGARGFGALSAFGLRAARAAAAALLALCAAAAAQVPDAAGEDALRSALQAAEARPGAEGQALLQALGRLADHLASQGRARDAIALWQRALGEAEQRRGANHPDVAIVLDRMAALHGSLGEHDAALALYPRSIAILERARGIDHVDVGEALSNHGVALRRAGRLDDAARVLGRALSILSARAGEDDPRVSIATGNLALVEIDRGHYREALALQQRSGEALERRLGPTHRELAANLSNRAAIHDLLGQGEQALPLYRRSLDIVEQHFGADSLRAADVLGNLSGLLRRLGRTSDALQTLERSLAIRERRLGPEHLDVANSLNNLAVLHQARGDLALALAPMQRSVAIMEARLGEHPRVATALVNLAMLYYEFGQYGPAAQIAERGIALLERRLGADHPEVASALANLGGIALARGDAARALALQQRALEIRDARLEAGHPDIARSLNNVAAVHLAQHRAAEALPLLQRARAISESRAAPDELAVVTAINNIAVAQAEAGALDEAGRTFREAIVRAQSSTAARAVLWKSQQGLSELHARLGHADLAIVWGKEAVNTLQALRADLTTVERALQTSYAQTRRGAYDRLADLLIEQGRIAEAQGVLQMLKEDELHEGLQRADSTDPRTTRIELTGLERTRFAPYYDLRDRQAALAAQRIELQRRPAPLSAEDARRLARIDGELSQAEEAMRVFFAQLEREMSAASGAAAGRGLALESSRLRQAVDALAASEPQAMAVGVQYLVTDQRLSIVLTLPGSPPIAVQRGIGRPALYERIARVLLQLKNPASEAERLRPQLRELHEWLIEPIAADLERFGARTLMLSLDDQLRLIPFAALLDERERFLVQDYTLALYNEAARQTLQRGASAVWRVAAMGLSEAVDDLPALQSVPQEIRAVVQAKGAGGDTYLNREFDHARLVGALDGPYNVLHVASHFVLQPGLPGQSRLYLGDKSRLTLADIARQDLKFGRLELVTFSACETARGGGREPSGQEMESLGAKAQNQGAQAVLATLWNVDDHSTGQFMQRFYALRGERQLNKAEALRAVQSAMLDGTLRPSRRQDWRAPYHWAPFVLMGNWR